MKLILNSLIIGVMLISLASNLFAEPVGSTSEWRYPRYDLNNSAAAPLLAPGNFGSPRERWKYSIPAATLSGIAVADINGDGRLEAVIGGNGKIAAIRVDDGTKLWEQTLDRFVGWASPVIADVNGDGKPEVVVGAATIYALNGSDGSIVWRRLPVNEKERTCAGMTVADVNGDGNLDVIYGDYNSPRKVHLLDGKTGAEKWTFQTTGTMYSYPTVADINKDGKQEILFHTHLYLKDKFGSERLYCLDRSGKEMWHFDATLTPEQKAKMSPELGFISDFGYVSPTVADFNGDGKPETGFGTDLNYYVVNSNGKLVWRKPTGISPSNMWTMKKTDGTIEYLDVHYEIWDQAVGDLAGNGKPNIILGLDSNAKFEYDYATQVTTNKIEESINKVIAMNGADGKTLWSFEGEKMPPDEIGWMAHPIICDVNGDGKQDIVVASSDGNLYALDGTSGKKIWSYKVELKPTELLGRYIAFVGVNPSTRLLFFTTPDTLHCLEIKAPENSAQPAVTPAQPAENPVKQ